MIIWGLEGETNMMKYQIVGRGIDVTPAMKDVAVKKISHLEKYFDSNEEIRCLVTFSVSHLNQMVEINIHTPVTALRAKVQADDAYVAIDLAIDKLEGQIRKMKTQVINQHHRHSLAEDMNLEMVETYADEDKEDMDKIVKRKNLALAPMDAEEALARMEALDHSFFVYLDAASQKTCIIYRREDGRLGLIELDH